MVSPDFPDEAIGQLQVIVKLTPNDPRVYREMGELYLRQKQDPRRAQQYFAKSLRLNSDQPDLLQILSQPPPETRPALPEGMPTGLIPMPSVPMPPIPEIPGE